MDSISESSSRGPAQAPFLLLVDDDEDQLVLFSALLKNADCVVVTASSATAALDILRDVHIDLVVTDVNMPGVDGKEFISRVRKASTLSRLPVIAFSAVPEYAENDLLSCGADAFCRKTEARSLSRQVHNILNDVEKKQSLLEQVQERFSS